MKTVDSVTAHERTNVSVAVNLISQGVRVVLQFISTIILARLLIPEDYGVIGIVLIFLNFFNVFKELGVTQAVIFAPTLDQIKVSGLFWITSLLGLVLAVLFALGGNLIALLFDDNRITAISAVLAVSFILSGLIQLPRALLMRNQQMVDLAIVETISFSLAILVAVWAALNDFHYWSLVILQLVNLLFLTVLVWFKTRWFPALTLQLSTISDILKFGVNLTASNFLSYLSRNADDFLVAKLLGTESLGYYSRAYSLIMIPLNNLNAPIIAALFPVLSRQGENRQTFKTTFLKAVRWINILTTPAFVFLTLYGEEITRLVLGDGWQPAGYLVSIMAFAAIFQPLGNLSGLLLGSLGQTARMVRWSIASTTWILFAMIIGIQYGLLGIAIAYAIAIKIQQPVLLWYSLKKSPVDMRSYLLQLVPGLVLACIVLLVDAIFFR